MSIENLLGHLEMVRQTGAGTWLARCPSHADEKPSLAVKEECDGRILIHCFAGCGAGEVLHSMGMHFADLYPTKQSSAHSSKRARRPFSPSDVLSALAFEVLFVWDCAKHLAANTPLHIEDQTRLLTAVIRLQRGYEVCNRG